MWPEIWRLAEEKIARAHSDGHRVCVIDAAVMLNAGWQSHMHEVWVTIAPDAEVSDHPNPFLFVTLLTFRLEPWDMECVIFLEVHVQYINVHVHCRLHMYMLVLILHVIVQQP